MKLLTLAMLTSTSNALIGIGIDMYNPLCAFACRRAIASAPLECTETTITHGHSGHGSTKTTPACFGSDSYFLTTLAWCIKTRCEPDQIPTWRLERYWYNKATNDATIQAKWTYYEALEQVVQEPTIGVNTSARLNYTGVVSDAKFVASKNGLGAFEYQETLHARYGMVLLVVGLAIPIVFTLFAFLPGFSRASRWLRPHLILPPAVTLFRNRSLPYNLGVVPTRGQAAYVALFVALNVLLTAMPYRTTQPNSFMTDRKSEILVYIANRTGVIAFALAPLTILFAGRNNLLLWITNWSHSTYLLLHRWIARIFTLQIILHSIVEVELYKYQGEYESEVQMPYWIWGIVATLCACIMAVVSTLYFRKLAYEAFLVLHIILAAFVIIGSWYHVELLFKRRWGYEMWLYAACAVWFFDRICRAIWIAANGVLSANIKEIGDGVVRIDIPGVRWSLNPGQHAYVYFPGVKSLLFWQCHPFSVIPLLRCEGNDEDTAENSLLRSPLADDSCSDRDAATADAEKLPPPNMIRTHSVKRKAPVNGIRLYLRKHKGITQALSILSRTTVLVEGPYHNHSPSFSTSVLRCDRIILLAGGIGITGVISFLPAHPLTKLYWSVKAASQPLVDDVVESGLLKCTKHQEPVINIGGPRLDFRDILEQEARPYRSRTRFGVVVCGPPTFCDDARNAVVEVGKKLRVDFELWEESFSW